MNYYINRVSEYDYGTLPQLCQSLESRVSAVMYLLQGPGSSNFRCSNVFGGSRGGCFVR